MNARFQIAVVVIGGLIAMRGGQLALRAQATRSVWDGVYTEEQAKRGEARYRSDCAGCHGDNLTGGETEPPLAGGDFLTNWDGSTVGDLFDRIRTSMPADRPGKLTREQTSDVLAYLFRMNHFPSGAAELEHQTEILKEIRIEAARPEKK